MANPTPVEIRRIGTHAVRVVWDDGHESELRNRDFRAQCPCAECRERPRTLPIVGDKSEELYPVRIGLIGRYAVSVQWSDGHDTGIYSYRTLRAICPCAACHPAVPAPSDAPS